MVKRTEVKTHNPFNGQELGSYMYMSDQQLSDCLSHANDAFQIWKVKPVSERTAVLLNAASILTDNKSRFSRLITEEMGKPIAEAEAEVLKCATVCRYYAEHAEDFLRSTEIISDAQRSSVRFDALGTILAVMPWNFPFWQVFRFLAPALAEGNTAVLKHASNVLGCGEAIRNLMLEAGCPPGVFQHLIIDYEQVETVLQSSYIKAATLTGSEKAGAAVASLAGKYLKKTVLELGGSNAFIVLDDANLDEAVSLGVRARMLNGGQSCIAAKRFIITAPLYDAFIERFEDAVRKLAVGNPLDSSTQIGPLARKDLADSLHQQVQDAIDKGARLLCGGRQNDCFYQPSVLADVVPGMRVFDEETFGPVAAIVKASNVDEAIRLSELSNYGLGVTICTSDIERADILAESFSDGAVFINELVKSDPRLPFGGTKLSGYGRELSKDGIMEFVNRKVVYVA